MTWGTAERSTLAEVVERQAEKYGAKTCAYVDGSAITYTQLHRLSNAYANALSKLGLRRAECVAVLMENCVEMVYIWIAAAKLGAIEVAINSAYKGEFLRHQLAKSQATIVIADASLAPRILAIIDQLPHIRTLIVRRDNAIEEALPPSALTLVDIAELSTADQSRVEAEPPRWDDPCTVQFTGGTTGLSKGALMTQNQLVSVAHDFIDATSIGETDVLYAPLPLFHLNAKVCVLLQAILAGGTAVVDRRFSVSRTWEQVRRYNATGMSILGSMALMLWNLPPEPSDANLPIRFIIGLPIPAHLHNAMEERYHCRLILAYGTSESGTLTLSTMESPATPGSSGRPLPNREIRLVDADDREVPIGAVGEVICRPRQPHVMFEGYFRDPEATLEAFRGLWFHTGDLGRFDQDGNFYFVDRKKDSIRRRGENVSSIEVEECLLKHPAVLEVAAHAVASEFTEDDIKVCVITRPDRALTEHDLMGYCVASMPFFAVPRYVEFVTDLPRSPVGRVLKHVLRERGITPQTWDRDAAGYQVPRR